MIRVILCDDHALKMIDKTDDVMARSRKSHRYFKDMDGEKPTSIYEMVLKNIEKPMTWSIQEGPRIVAAAKRSGKVLQVGSRPLRIAHTPGHARHHHCIWDSTTRGWFTGDTFGLSYREFDTAHGAWIVPTSTPVQFEPEALKQSCTSTMLGCPSSVAISASRRKRANTSASCAASP